MSLSARNDSHTALHHLAFNSYLCRGEVPEKIGTMHDVVMTPATGQKFNPYHDPHSGQCTTGLGPHGVGESGTEHHPQVPALYPPYPDVLLSAKMALYHYMGGSSTARNFYLNSINSSNVKAMDLPSK